MFCVLRGEDIKMKKIGKFIDDENEIEGEIYETNKDKL